LGKVTHVLQTNVHMFDPLNLYSVKTVVYLWKRSHNPLSPRFCSKVKKYFSPQLNSTIGWFL